VTSETLTETTSAFFIEEYDKMAVNLAELTKTPSGDRPLYKRLTLIGGAILALSNYAESQGVAPPGTFEAFQNTQASLYALANSIGGLLTLFGVYRQVSTD